MRPLYVRMQAFGPYSATQELDFAELGSNDFFLITGPTGSGKTTVLDAMAFALYGDTSGGERDPRDMRSQHAAPDLLTEVQFDFAIGDERYRILRRPQQERPKKVGGGTTTHLQEATIWRLATTQDGPRVPDKPLADGWTDVTRAAEDTLGFRSQQFRQVVMLPQGRFQELLQAKSQDKEKILSALFDTAFYARIEQALKTRAQVITDEHDRLVIERDAVLRQAGVADADDLTAQLGSVCGERDRAAGGVKARSDELAVAQKTLADAQAAVAKLADLAAARERSATLDALAGEIDRDRAELAAAQKAAPLAGDHEAVGERHDDVTARESVLVAARELLAARETEKDDADAALAAEEARAPAREQAAEQARGLKSLEPTVEGIGALATELDHARQRRDGAIAEAAEAGSAAIRADRELAAAVQRLQQVRAAAAGSAALEAVAEQAAATARQRRDLDAAAARHAAAAAQVTDLSGQSTAADGRYSAAVEHLRALEADWEAGQAARLATSLETGQPCPVCGSTEHPAPARHDERPVPADDDLDRGRATLDRLFAERDAARLELADAERRRQQAGVERDQLTKTLGEAAELSIELCDERARTAAEQRDEAVAAEEATGALEEIERRAREASDRARATHEAAETSAAELRSAADKLSATLSERRRGVPPELADPAALATAIVAAEQSRCELDKTLAAAQDVAKTSAIALEQARTEATNAAQQVEDAREAARKVDERFAGRMGRQGFADVASWGAALRDASRVAELEAAIREYDDQVVAAGANLAQAEKTASGLEPPDLDAFTAAAEAARALADEAAATKAALDARQQTLDHARAELERIAAASASLDEQYAVAGLIAKVATGDNRFKLNFQRFVLGVHLDRVLQIATHRLRDMTGKRYDLERTDLTRGRSRTAGLDLEVFDAWTGENRPVSTLSGGESFMAALSLALGLAEAVQEFSGGIRLDTIFVDEGFGSLDTEALDHAITTLTTLQENGRLVGIISHLAELRERIDARLEVTAGKAGSTARFVVP